MLLYCVVTFAIYISFGAFVQSVCFSMLCCTRGSVSFRSAPHRSVDRLLQKASTLPYM